MIHHYHAHAPGIVNAVETKSRREVEMEKHTKRIVAMLRKRALALTEAANALERQAVSVKKGAEKPEMTSMHSRHGR